MSPNGLGGVISIKDRETEALWDSRLGQGHTAGGKDHPTSRTVQFEDFPLSNEGMCLPEPSPG